MSSSKKIPPSASHPPLSSEDREALKQQYSKAIEKAIREGLQLFFSPDPFENLETREHALVALEHVGKSLPEIVCSLLVGTLFRETDFKLPAWRTPKRSKGGISKAEREKVIETALPHFQEVFELEWKEDFYMDVGKRAVEKKMIEPLIGDSASPTDLTSVAFKFWEDGVIESVAVHRLWIKVLPAIMLKAALGDDNFFERLGRALSEGRKSTWSKAEMLLLANWDKTRKCYDENTPGLKFWRDEAVRSLLSAIFYQDQDGGLSLTAYRSIRDRLGLRAEKKKTVKGCEARKIKNTGSIHLILCR